LIYRQYHHLPSVSYLRLIMTSTARFFPMLTGYFYGILVTLLVVVGSSVAIVLPTVLPIVAASYLQKQAVLYDMLSELITQFLMEMLQGFRLGFLGILSFSPLFLINLFKGIMLAKLSFIKVLIFGICLAIVLYYFLMGNLIVNKQTTAWDGLRQSWRLIQGNWFNTLGLVFIWGVLIGLLNYFLTIFFSSYSAEIISLLTFSLAPSIMVIYSDELMSEKRSKF
ncbi:MAG: hypothetical protein ACHQJ6_09060, partial [Candidatus Berkiellales bacterium]